MQRNIETLFGAIVRRHREESGISQEEFADRAGIHRTYQSSIERGKVHHFGVSNFGAQGPVAAWQCSSSMGLTLRSLATADS